MLCSPRAEVTKMHSPLLSLEYARALGFSSASDPTSVPCSRSMLHLPQAATYTNMLIFETFKSFIHSRKSRTCRNYTELIDLDFQPLLGSNTTAKKVTKRIFLHAEPLVDPPPSSGCYGFVL